jgi:Asp-tRNA(Asn)/Glu-tRNA(Gln) amidotransferase C subunit
MELPKNANETASPENNAAAIPNDLPINPIENTDIGGEPVRTPSSEEVEADPDVDNYFKKAYKLPAEEIIEQEGYVGAGQTQEESDREISDFFRRGYAMPSEDGEDIPAETNFQAPSDAAKDFNETMETQLQEVAAKLNVSRDEAYAMLSDKPIEEVIKTPELNRIVKGYPKVAAWAQSTGNYKKLIKAPEKAMSIDDNMSFAGKAFSEMSKLAKVNYANLLQVSIHGMMSSGKLDRNTGITKLRELDTLIRENQSEVYAQGVQNFGKRIEVAAGKFKAGSKTIDQADFSDNSSFSDYIADLGKYAKGLGQYGGGVGEIMASVKDDPAAFAVGVAGQSMYSMLPSTIASVGVGKLATIATLNPAIGALAGLTAGTITQGIVSYGQFFQMQTEKYTDKATGLVDYDKMYSDPAVIAEMQVQAAKYAGVHAVFEMTAGRFLTVNVSKAKAAIKVAGSTGAKAKIAAKTATKVTSSTAIEESAGEFTALTATGTPVDEALKEATVEGLAGVFMGIPTASIEYLRDSGTSPGVETAKKTALKDKFKDYIKAKDTVVKAEASMAAAESVKKTAQDLTDLDLKTSRDQAQDLIDRASVMESVDTEGEAETTQSTATMSLNELNNFAAQNGIEVETLLDSMGTEAKDAYYSSVNHGLSDFSFPIHELTMAANDHPELADIAYINDAEINAVEGLEISQNSDQVIESLNRDIESILKMSDETEGVETDADLMGASDVSEVNELGETVDTVLRRDGSMAINPKRV